MRSRSMQVVPFPSSSSASGRCQSPQESYPRFSLWLPPLPAPAAQTPPSVEKPHFPRVQTHQASVAGPVPIRGNNDAKGSPEVPALGTPKPAAGPHPELAPVAIIQLQDVAVHGAVGEGRHPPGQRDTVVVGAALLQLQQGARRHCDRDRECASAHGPRTAHRTPECNLVPDPRALPASRRNSGSILRPLPASSRHTSAPGSQSQG